MEDLISRAAAIDYLMTNMGWRDEDGYEVDDADEKRAIITDLVNGIPAVDAVPVVRCRDCKHRPHYDERKDLVFPDLVCVCQCVDDDFYSWMPDDDWFCVDGERRDDDGKDAGRLGSSR